MIKLSLKLDVSLSKLAFVIAGSAACYGISRCIFNFISSDTVNDEKNVSEDNSVEYPTKVCPSESI